MEYGGGLWKNNAAKYDNWQRWVCKLKQITDFHDSLCLLGVIVFLFLFNPITGREEGILLANESCQSRSQVNVAIYFTLQGLN